jgi:nucleoside diphosphate kinase
MAANFDERTYIMIKPDGVQRGLVGEIIKRFEQRGYRLSALKFVQVTKHSQFLHKTTFFYLDELSILPSPLRRS